MSDLLSATYNPDVLSCLANLSNDEVFTPPEVVNQMLDMLPEGIWSDRNATFLDPACKSGVFLREIAKRLIEAQLPNYEQISYEINEKLRAGGELDGRDIAFQNMLEDVIEHVFKNQVFGIAITELTSLLSRRSVYCSKYPQSEYSVVRFDNPEGRIDYKQMQHTWKNGKCVYCGAPKEKYDRAEGKEQYAYEFIHLNNPEEVFNMKFDVIIGNPPYQLEDGGHGKSSLPIYQDFVNQALKLNPRYLAMIIPSRWFAGGRGLDQFRDQMLNDGRIRKLVDYERFKDAFPGVDVAGGVCYFLWDRENAGDCEVINASTDSSLHVSRPLNEFPTFIRDNRAIDIVYKVREAHKGKYLIDTVSPSKPFGLRTFYEPKDEGIPCYFIQRIGKRFADPKDVVDQNHLLDKWKLLVPRSPIAGQTDFSKPVKFYYDGNAKIASPGECCTESFISVFASDNREKSILSRVIYTLVSRVSCSFNPLFRKILLKKYYFVPDLGHYEGEYTDEQLAALWGLDENDLAYIRTRIAAVDDE